MCNIPDKPSVAAGLSENAASTITYLKNAVTNPAAYAPPKVWCKGYRSSPEIIYFAQFPTNLCEAGGERDRCYPWLYTTVQAKRKILETLSESDLKKLVAEKGKYRQVRMHSA